MSSSSFMVLFLSEVSHVNLESILTMRTVPKLAMLTLQPALD